MVNTIEKIYNKKEMTEIKVTAVNILNIVEHIELLSLLHRSMTI